MGKKGFKKLLVWQKAKDLAVKIYLFTNKGELAKDFGLRDQIRRSAVSIPSNIAEGDERNSDKDAVRFFYIAKGSLAELRTQIQIASEVNLMKQNVFDEIESECQEIGKMLGGLIKARSKNL